MELVISQTHEPHNSYDANILSLECWNCGSIGHRKGTCPKFHCFYCGKKGHTKRICFNYKLVTTQKKVTTPESQELLQEADKAAPRKKKTPKRASLTHPINHIIEENLTSPKGVKPDATHSHKRPTNYFAIPKTTTNYNPETSPITLVNHNPEHSPITNINSSHKTLTKAKTTHKVLREK